MEGYIGEIRMFAADFAPKYWAYCQGQSMPISTNQALFSILGVTFGGNGQSTFNLPDLRGRVAVGTGNGGTLPAVVQGQQLGQATVALTAANLPSHTHTFSASAAVSGTATATMSVNSSAATSSNPKDNYLGLEQGGAGFYATAAAANQTLNSGAIQVAANTLGINTAAIVLNPTGGGNPIDLNMPSIGMNFVICLQGLYPSRN